VARVDPPLSAEPGGPSEPGAERARRPLVERLGLAGLAVVVAVLFAGLALAAWSEGEIFLAVMAAIGALMTLWAAGSSVLRA
jgi:hypothetical protein